MDTVFTTQQLAYRFCHNLLMKRDFSKGTISKGLSRLVKNINIEIREWVTDEKPVSSYGAINVLPEILPSTGVITTLNLLFILPLFT